MSKSSSTSGKVSDGGPTAELEQLRVEARSRGVEWLLTAVSALKRDEVRKLAQAQICLRVELAVVGYLWLSYAKNL